MTQKGKIYCFQADYQDSITLDKSRIPDWLSLSVNWQGYRISTVPWVADVARLLGLLPIEDTPEAWMNYLESLGFKGITQKCCEAFFEDSLYY